MRGSKKETARLISLILLCLVFGVIISSIFGIFLMYRDDVNQEANFRGSFYANNIALTYQEKLDVKKANVEVIKQEIEDREYSGYEDFVEKFDHQFIGNSSRGVLMARFFKDGLEYRSDGTPFSGIENKKVKDNIDANKITCLGVTPDHEISYSTISYIIPLKNIPYADSVVVFFSVDDIVPIKTDINLDDYPTSVVTLISSSDNEVLSILERENNEVFFTHANVFECLLKITNEKNVNDTINQAVKKGQSISTNYSVNGTDYIVSASSITDNEVSILYVLTIYDIANVHSVGTTFTDVALVLMIIFCILVIFVVIYNILTRRKLQSLKLEDEDNAFLNCPKEHKFTRLATEIIRRNKNSLFAVIVIDIKHYDYLMEQVGQEGIDEGLKKLKNLISKSMSVEETFGYLNNGRFVILVHYRDKNYLADRIQNLSLLAASNTFKESNNMIMEIYGGIYLSEAGLTPNVSKMIELAIDAEKATEYPTDFASFRIYNQMIYQSAVQNDYIELNMEKALAHNDFKIFYQPKMNIQTKHIDGAEALVRWYNPELDDYMQPGVFLPLFEANKFIIKVDHYVYEQVCKYIREAADNSLPICPISVNVSRITASEKGFIETYVKIKQKYGIADDFITIEFTESFGFEDYAMMRDMVIKLHQNGFKCSIDDFGSGFSSYNILKELPMDEIKLDRFFVKDSYSKDRDLMILSSIIELGKSLHMKVTQEGVENIDQFNLLKKLGCHVIQGYLYSKPLALTDFMDFIRFKSDSLGR